MFFLLFSIAHLGHPCPYINASPVVSHSCPHILHLTFILDLHPVYSSKSSIFFNFLIFSYDGKVLV